jgi:hypothetical protein
VYNNNICVARKEKRSFHCCLPKAAYVRKNVKITLRCRSHSLYKLIFISLPILFYLIKKSYWASQLKEQLGRDERIPFINMIVARQQIIIIDPPYDWSLNWTAGEKIYPKGKTYKKGSSFLFFSFYSFKWLISYFKVLSVLQTSAI